jgi:hypothetical protein
MDISIFLEAKCSMDLDHPIIESLELWLIFSHFSTVVPLCAWHWIWNNIYDYQTMDMKFGMVMKYKYIFQFCLQLIEEKQLQNMCHRVLLKSLCEVIWHLAVWARTFIYGYRCHLWYWLNIFYFPVWLSTLKSSTVLAPESGTVPFLPVNPEFSATRNQGRQKLARFNAREFATLIIDILSDAKRRQSPISSSLVVSQGK